MEKSYNSVNISGEYIIQSENIINGKYVNNLKNARNVIFVGSPEGNENFLDTGPGGGGGGDDFYAVGGAGDGSNNIYCSTQIGSSTNIYYSYYLEGCSYCIGCIGLKNKSYCILNKQYTKEQWENILDKIFSQMEREPHPNPLLAGEGETALGAFFPGSLNSFYFNDTMAGILGDFTKQEVEKEGYMWRDEEIKVDILEGSDVIKSIPLSSSLPKGERIKSIQDFQGYDKDGNWKINPEILKKVIKDGNGNYYRIVKMEYDFLVKHSLPLPEIHRMDRMRLNFGV